MMNGLKPKEPWIPVYASSRFHFDQGSFPFFPGLKVGKNQVKCWVSLDSRDRINTCLDFRSEGFPENDVMGSWFFRVVLLHIMLISLDRTVVAAVYLSQLRSWMPNATFGSTVRARSVLRTISLFGGNVHLTTGHRAPLPRKRAKDRAYNEHNKKKFQTVHKSCRHFFTAYVISSRILPKVSVW